MSHASRPLPTALAAALLLGAAVPTAAPAQDQQLPTAEYAQPPELPAGEIARLERGETVVSVTPDKSGGNRVRAAVDISAPPSVVWDVMIDCSQAYRIVPRLKSCRVLERAEDGSWDFREHRIGSPFLLMDLKTVFRLDYMPDDAIHFRWVSGDMKGSEGEWRLTPIRGGSATRVVYDARLRLGVAPALVRGVLRQDAPRAMQALRRESMMAASRAYVAGYRGSPPGAQ